MIYPESFVERVKASLEGSGVELEVLDKAAMAKLGMGALLGVAQGSIRDPRLLILKWNGGEAGTPPTPFVGKGGKFDTRGHSVQPAPGQGSEEGDEGGGG